jgi:hypothetical protein
MTQQSDSFKGNIEGKNKGKFQGDFHWEWFSELFTFYFGAPPTDGKAQRKKYAQRCREDGEKFVLLALRDFMLHNAENAFDDITAAGWVFLTTEYDEHRFDDNFKLEYGAGQLEGWVEEEEAASLFEKWFGMPVAEQKPRRRGSR